VSLPARRLGNRPGLTGLRAVAIAIVVARHAGEVSSPAATAFAFGFAGVDIDNYPEVAARYEVLSIPTVILFADGEPQETLVGARPRSHFERTFAPWLGLSESDPS